jgi:hypothetical protein
MPKNININLVEGQTMARRKFEECLAESGGGAIGELGAAPELDSVAQEEAITPDKVRAEAIALLPIGADEALKAMAHIGVAVPEAVVLEGQTEAEAIEQDTRVLNLLLARMVGLMKVQSQAAAALNEVDRVLGERFALQLQQQRQASDQRVFGMAMAAAIGGDGRGNFRPASYQLPQGWAEFGRAERQIEEYTLEAESVS